MSEPTYRVDIYRAPAGQWSGMVTNTDTGEGEAYIAGCASPDEVEAAAHEQWWPLQVVNITDPYHGLREDGEILTGYDWLDYPPSLTHPGDA